MKETLTAKLQVIVTPEQSATLDRTMDVYRQACSYVSDYVFRNRNLKQIPLHKALYHQNIIG